MNTILIIYLSGYFAAYIAFRLMKRYYDKQLTWTTGDRRAALLTSLLSWLLVLVVLAVLLLDFITDYSDNRPAKW